MCTYAKEYIINVTHLADMKDHFSKTAVSGGNSVLMKYVYYESINSLPVISWFIIDTVFRTFGALSYLLNASNNSLSLLEKL